MSKADLGHTCTGAQTHTSLQPCPPPAPPGTAPVTAIASRSAATAQPHPLAQAKTRGNEQVPEAKHAQSQEQAMR